MWDGILQSSPRDFYLKDRGTYMLALWICTVTHFDGYPAFSSADEFTDALVIHLCRVSVYNGDSFLTLTATYTWDHFWGMFCSL